MSDRRLSSHLNPAFGGLWSAGGVSEPTLFYRVARSVLKVGFSTFWRTRVFNRHFEPAEGGAVYISNHQSFMDPILMSMALHRPMDYMARDSLFRTPLFKRLITSVNAFPVRRGMADTAAIKEAARRLAAGRQVVVFPEGTRTGDGRIGAFLQGVALLARRAGAVTVPVLIDGAFECWPRTRMLPFPGEIVVQYGRPIPAEKARAMRARQFVSHVRDHLIAIQTDVRRRLGRPAIVYPDG